jgi:copper ion binding protein
MSNEKTRVDPGQPGSATIQVSGMTCEHCAKRVEKALSAVAGVREVTVDLPGGRAEVQFDPTNTNIAALQSAIVKSGYQVYS